MEEYNDVENDTTDACDAPDATTTTMRGPEHKARHQQVRRLDAEVEKNQSEKLKVLRPTSKNRAA